MDSFKDKVILLTGASSGIGWAAAHLLAKEGARLALAARREDRLHTLAKELRDAYGNDPLVLRTDVRRKEDVVSMVETAHASFGRLDVLINNAGVLYMGPFLTMPESKFRDLLETNFWPLIHAIRAAVPFMARQGRGHIVNVGSVASRRGLPFMAAYCASKFALAGLTESLRLELRPQGIKLTSVFPGAVDTEMPQNLDRSSLPEGYPHRSRGPISAERAARAVVKAVARQCPEVYVPWWTRYAAWLSVLSPSAADRLIRLGYRNCL